MRLLITGLSGKSGRVLANDLNAQWGELPMEIRVAVRPHSEETVRGLLPQAELCVGDLQDEAYLARVTRDVDVVLNIAGVGTSGKLVPAAVENGVRHLILVHTTGIYSKYKAAGEGYRRIEAEIDRLTKEHGVTVTYLRPTMIYGTLKDANIVKFIKMVDKLSPMPVVNHGTYLLQPVHCADLGHAYFKLLHHLEETAGKNYILSGRDPILLVDMFRIIADELGVRRRFVSVPFPIAYAGAWVLYLLSLKRIDMREKVQRLCEGRDFPHEEAVKDFGYDPMPFEEGLRAEVRDYLAAKNAAK